MDSLETAGAQDLSHFCIGGGRRGEEAASQGAKERSTIHVLAFRSRLNDLSEYAGDILLLPDRPSHKSLGVLPAEDHAKRRRLGLCPGNGKDEEGGGTQLHA